VTKGNIAHLPTLASVLAGARAMDVVGPMRPVSWLEAFVIHAVKAARRSATRTPHDFYLSANRATRNATKGRQDSKQSKSKTKPAESRQKLEPA
jgi:hypothetical protein